MLKKFVPVLLATAFGATAAFAAGEENKHMTMDHKPTAAEKAQKPAKGAAANGAGEENKHMTMDHKPGAAK